MPDAVIDSHTKKADFILVPHTHYDHALDVPHIALKTHARLIGTESTENIARAYSVPEDQLITVRGGEDYDFGVFSLKVVPSLHSPLNHKHYFSSTTAPAGMKAPLTLEQMHPGGGTAYLIRIHGHQILAFGGMNYVEREIEGLTHDGESLTAIANTGATLKVAVVRRNSGADFDTTEYPELLAAAYEMFVNDPALSSDRIRWVTLKTT